MADKKPAHESILRLFRNAKTVEDIIADLQELPPKAIPVFTVSYGDRGRTKQALPITEIRLMRDNDQNLYHTAYSESEVALRDIDDDDYEDGNDPHELLNEDLEQVDIVVFS